MEQEIKDQLLECFTTDKEILFDLTFNTNFSFYEEPKNFEDYIDLIKDFKKIKLLSIIENFYS